jgi:hypothetical protein
MLGFYYCSMTVLGEKLGGRPVDRSASVLRIVLRALFIGSNGVRSTLLGQHERLPRIRTVRRKPTGGVCGPAQEAYVSCVSGFPCRVYIDSNGHVAC